MMKGVVDFVVQEIQCECVYVFFEFVGNDESVVFDECGCVFWNIYYQCCDVEMLVFLCKYEDYFLFEVCEQVGKVIQLLVEKYDLGV